ncbi:hypothetical protein [Conexibacter sp. SYSU D00693]|uniref:hypothetical protein n=1 Tax=Conexibacter sp. SYSU D00693 TaxID=2812560 RepID=UPI00196A200C|nr:hypothetical protein [Conexibacter sp. SYSU D00693]
MNGRVATLIDRTWPWLPVGLVVLAAIVLVGSYANAKGPTAVEQAQDVAEDFGAAAAASDGEALCDAMTPAFRKRLVGGITKLPCSEVARNFGVGVPGAQLRDAPRQLPKVAGQVAVVDQPTIGVRLVLLRREGTWRVERLVRRPAAPAA